MSLSTTSLRVEVRPVSRWVLVRHTSRSESDARETERTVVLVQLPLSARRAPLVSCAAVVVVVLFM